MRPNLWKLSHGTEHFSFTDLIQSIADHMVYVHKDAGPIAGMSMSQSENFISAPIGDYFYLTFGNEGIYLIGQFITGANIFTKYGKDWQGWIERSYKLIKVSKNFNSYNDTQRWWTPNFRSTFVRIPEDQLNLFEESILIPFFDMKLSDYGID